MKDAKQFVSKYAIFIFVVGVVIIILMNSSISNLPSPFFLVPGQATREYYTPLRIYRFIRLLGVLITLVGAFFFVRNIAVADKEGDGKMNEFTKAISDSFSDLVSEIKQTPPKSATPPNKENIQNSSAGRQQEQNNVLVGGLAPKQETKKTYIIEVRRQQTQAGMDFVYTDRNHNTVVGIHNILTHLTGQGYRIINTIQTTSNNTEVIEIIFEV